MTLQEIMNKRKGYSSSTQIINCKVGAEVKPAPMIEAQENIIKLAREICRKIKDFDEMLEPEGNYSCVAGVHVIYRDLEEAIKELDG